MTLLACVTAGASRGVLCRDARADGVLASASRAAFIAVATKQRYVKHLLWRSVQAISAVRARRTDSLRAAASRRLITERSGRSGVVAEHQQVSPLRSRDAAPRRVLRTSHFEGTLGPGRPPIRAAQPDTKRASRNAACRRPVHGAQLVERVRARIGSSPTSRPRRGSLPQRQHNGPGQL